jgi:hypothetical protein
VSDVAKFAQPSTSNLAAAVGLAVILLVGAGGCGGDDLVTPQEDGQTATAPAQPITITLELNEANKSGQSGTAVLTDKEESESGISLGTGVALEVDPSVDSPDEVQLAAIHGAPCEEVVPRRGFEELGTTEIQTLDDVRGRRSETTAAQSVAELSVGGLAITVHEPKPPFRAVVCGDIPADVD